MVIDFFTVIFRLTLFALFAYKVTSLIKAYLIPFLQQEVNDEQKKQTELLEKEKLLISTQHRLEHQINQQKKIISLLEKKVLDWHVALQAQHQDRQREIDQWSSLVSEKRKKQFVYLQRAKDGHVVVPMACAQARQELALLYAHKKGSTHISSLIRQIASDVSN